MPDVYRTGSPIFEQMAAARGNPYLTPVYNSMVDPLTGPLDALGSPAGSMYAPAPGAWPAQRPVPAPLSPMGMAPMGMPMPVPAQMPGYPVAVPGGMQNTDALARLLTDTLGGGSGSNCVAVLIFGDAGMAQQLQQYLPGAGVQNGFGRPAPAYGPGAGPGNGTPIGPNGQPGPNGQVFGYQDTGNHPIVPGATAPVPALPSAGGWRSDEEGQEGRHGIFGRVGAAMRELRGH